MRGGARWRWVCLAAPRAKRVCVRRTVTVWAVPRNRPTRASMFVYTRALSVNSGRKITRVLRCAKQRSNTPKTPNTTRAVITQNAHGVLVRNVHKFVNAGLQMSRLKTRVLRCAKQSTNYLKRQTPHEQTAWRIFTHNFDNNVFFAMLWAQ